MKNRIWKLAAVILFTVMVWTNLGQAMRIKASEAESTGLKLTQSAQWMDGKEGHAQIIMEISGLKAYREAWARKIAEELPKEEPEETGTEPVEVAEELPETREEAAEEAACDPYGREEGKESWEENFAEENGDYGWEEDFEVENGEDSWEEETEKEISEDTEEDLSKKNISEETAETFTEEFKEKNPEATPEELYEENLNEESFYEESFLGDHMEEWPEDSVDLEEMGIPAAGVNAIFDEFAEAADAEDGMPELKAVAYLSEYFLLDEETLPPDYQREEVQALSAEGQTMPVTRVVFPVNYRAYQEDVYRISFGVSLKEEYLYGTEALSYPVFRDAPVHNEDVGSGVRLVEIAPRSETEPESERIVAQSLSPLLEVQAANADFALKLRGEAQEVKAGSSYTYELKIKNTGDLPLSEIRIGSSLSTEELSSEEIKAVWENTDGVRVSGKEAVITQLKRGESLILYMTVQLEEGAEGTLRHHLAVQAPCPKNAGESIGKEADAETKILPLKADFTVEKTADRKEAYPGDTITYQICIRNTGERTLHSILSTERFLGANVQAQFTDKVGVTLNSTRTQALIKEILPGDAVALTALVTLPQYITGQQLVNQVTVVTQETGAKSQESQASVEVKPQYGSYITPTPNLYGAYQVDYSSGSGTKTAYAPSSKPQTGDDTKTGGFILLLTASVLAGTGVFWKGKGKSKD